MNFKKPTYCLILILLFSTAVQFAASAQTLLDANTHPKFKQTLPIPAEINAKQGGTFNINMKEKTQWLGLDKNGQKLYTKIWGYGQGNNITFPGPTIRAKKDVPVKIKWKNKLPYQHILPVDNTLHMAHPNTGIATVTHLHGGHTESASDGLPEAWFTQGFNESGPTFVKKKYHYDNDQESATLWYHDHALGLTRLNVYAGLAGFYLLNSPEEQALVNEGILPKRRYEIEMVIQDRMFESNGALFLPSKTGDPWFGDPNEPLELPFSPSVVAEFFGDFILVNGMVWPKKRVEPRKYRFRLLNGSDSRFYVLKFSNGMSFLQIGTDNGLLPFPESIKQLTLAPGERAEVILDFGAMDGQFIVMQNIGPDEPFKGNNLNPDVTRPTGQIMQFRVTKPLNTNIPDATVSLTTRLRPDIAPLVQDGATRKLGLFEGMDADGRLQPLLGIINGDQAKSAATLNGSLAWFETVTETPMLNDTEVWEVYNATEDAHPIHLHAIAFQILDRTPFTATVNTQPQVEHGGGIGVGGYIEESSIVFTGPAELPPATEKGWKDTFIVPPGYMGRVIAKFDIPGRYVWHCHILSHEDHEMMRPMEVLMAAPLSIPEEEEEVVETSTRLLEQVDQIVEPLSPQLEQNFPNPFREETSISFVLVEESNIQLAVYNAEGKLIGLLAKGKYPVGKHTLIWDGLDAGGNSLPNGIYFYQLRVGEKVLTKRIVLNK